MDRSDPRTHAGRQIQSVFAEAGVFVEVGGLDGVLGSNTYYFEKSLGWTGLIVEPSPRMVAAIRKVRGCEVVHAAIADFDGHADFLEITAGYTQMSGLVDSYPEDMLRTARAHPDHHEQVITNRSSRSAPCAWIACSVSTLSSRSIIVQSTSKAPNLRSSMPSTWHSSTSAFSRSKTARADNNARLRRSSRGRTMSCLRYVGTMRFIGERRPVDIEIQQAAKCFSYPSARRYSRPGGSPARR